MAVGAVEPPGAPDAPLATEAAEAAAAAAAAADDADDTDTPASALAERGACCVAAPPTGIGAEEGGVPAPTDDDDVETGDERVGGGDCGGDWCV